MTDMTDAPTPAPPLLRVVRGNPTDEELAALVAVVAASSAGASAPTKRPVPAWSAGARRMRPALRAGRGGWRASGLPR